MQENWQYSPNTDGQNRITLPNTGVLHRTDLKKKKKKKKSNHHLEEMLL